MTAGAMSSVMVVAIAAVVFIGSVIAQPNISDVAAADADDRWVPVISGIRSNESSTSAPFNNYNSSVLLGFEAATAKRFLHYAYATYCPEASIRAWNCKWCKDATKVTTILKGAKTDTFGYVAYDATHNAVVLAFRGSKTLINWIEDLKFWKDQHPFDGVAGANVAKGFDESYASVAVQVQRGVRELLNAHPGATVYVTGHSLGGALATLAAFDLKQGTGIPTNEVYTFGSPRVGDAGFANAYAARVPKTWRMTNHQDIVVHLPPHAFNFFHVTQEIYEVQGNYKTDCKGGEDKACADGQLAISASDHTHYMMEQESC